MARSNAAFLAFNRGIVSPKGLARVDLERTQLSAETMTNWLPKTQGAMTVRPGTKYLGSSLNDSGAQYLEFVASTESTALLELTHQAMRVWLPSDTGHYLGDTGGKFETPEGVGLDVLLARPGVATTVTLTDTGWDNTSSGGVLSGVLTGAGVSDIIPTMTAQVTDGAEVTASSSQCVGSGFSSCASGRPYRAADDYTSTYWRDTGNGSTLPSWWSVDLDNAGTDTGRRQGVLTYSIRAGHKSAYLDNAPKAWGLLAGNYDTGTFATDTGKWTLEDERTGQIDWAISEKRSFTLPGADTGTVEARRHWRLNFTQVDTGAGTTSLQAVVLAEVEMFATGPSTQVLDAGAKRTFNATSIGALARLEKRVIVDTGDVDVEHGLHIDVERGPVTLRVGSTARADDFFSNTVLGTGHHHLAFTPGGNFFITIQSDETVHRIVGSLAMSDTGTVEIEAPWDAEDLDNVRHDQSADVTYVACDGVHMQKIERRGVGRSWSVVEYEPTRGPFRTFPSSAARLGISKRYGNTTLTSDIEFFSADHVGTLFRLVNTGQTGEWALGAKDAVTDSIEIAGISDTGDTGTPSQQSDRRLDISVTGTHVSTLQIERSYDGPDFGFHPVSTSADYIFGGTPSDTGTFSRVINDPDDNVSAWYRLNMISYTSGAAFVTMTYNGLSTSGIARVTDFNSSTSVDVEVLSRFSDTGRTDAWQEGTWSPDQGFPTAVALHAGRLAWAKGSQLALSVSDDYENFDDETVGDAAPILRTLGAGPVDNIHYLLSLLRLVIGTAGSEIAVRSSSLDEPVTAANSNARAFSTQGSASLRPVRLDNAGLFVQRSGQRLFSIGFASDKIDSDYTVTDLTALVPDLLAGGVVSIAIQRQPDTRIHCVLANGTVGILTFDPVENVLCWSTWEGDTGTGATVERVAALPGEREDAIYYHVRRTINGATKRYLERWAEEGECLGDTGLSWIADCAKSFTADTGDLRDSVITGFQHLAGISSVVWADDTGQTTAGKDLSPDVSGVQTEHAIGTGGAADTGEITLSESVHHAVVGIPYRAVWRSSKLAYSAEAGTPLAQMKRTDKIAFILYKVHNNGVFFGADTGLLDALPRSSDGGGIVDADKIFEHYDQVSMPFPGLWSSDSRVVLVARAPRPVTVLAAVPTVATNERI